jgi:hypothetical protein
LADAHASENCANRKLRLRLVFALDRRRAPTLLEAQNG